MEFMYLTRILIENCRLNIDDGSLVEDSRRAEFLIDICLSF